ncbi:hypothetical protein [Actinoplanes sp. NPDC051411]|uniref:hypothetical protein n=1 Tax=Actinoplanes sp. NPDC051411 TaxID=3155522 RepID=UPI003414CB46
MATIAAFAVMGLLAAGALAALGAPVNWPFIATAVAAALGGPASLTGSLATGRVTASVHGTVGVLPLGLAVPAAVVFCVVLAGSARTPVRAVAVRAAGAAVTTTAVLVAVLAAGDGTLRIALPAGKTLLAVRPDAGATVLGAVFAFVLLAGFCALLALVPHGRIVAGIALLGTIVPTVIALVAALVAAGHRPAVAGVALLFGVNAVLVAVLSGFGAAPPALTGPMTTRLHDSAGGQAWLLGDSAGPVAVRLGALAAFILLGAAVLAMVPPGAGGDRWRRAGRRAAVAGATLAAVLAGMSAAGGGSLELGLAVLFFNAPVLGLHVAPAVGWALLAGALSGGLAGLVGSLVADARARGLSRSPVEPTLPAWDEASERG